MITTHVLDLSTGKPAAGVRVVLSRIADGQRMHIGSGVTDADGRLKDLVTHGAFDAGIFELTFETGAYFSSHGVHPFHPRVSVTVDVNNPEQHYHVPLLISPFGYTTYRGS
jgi:5-hydroxyisourate hydrolase